MSEGVRRGPVDNFRGELAIRARVVAMDTNRDPIPTTPIRTHHDLLTLWEAIVGEPGFGRRTLWLSFLDDDHRPMKMILPFDDMPESVDTTAVGRLFDCVKEARVAGTIPYASVVVMFSRPGSGRIREDDRAWARALHELLADQTPRWPVHLATDDGVVVLAPDDLVVGA